MNQIQAPENQSRVRRPRTWLRLGLVLIFLGAIGGGLIFFHQFKANILKQVVTQITSQLPTVATATDTSAPSLTWLSSTARKPRSVMIIMMNWLSWMPIWKPTLPLPML